MAQFSQKDIEDAIKAVPSQQQWSEEDLKSAVSAVPSGQKIEVLDESSDIPWYDRAMVKNFGGSEQEQIDYLKKQNPNLDISSVGGEIVAKRPEEKAWKKLDPSGLLANLNPIEMMRDALDLGTDIGSGALSTVAGTAAAIPAAGFTGGAGAIPAAMAASGATSAGTEAIRQGLGKWFGTIKEYKPEEIRSSAIMGAIAPALFGTGATTAQLAKGVESPSLVRKILEKAKIESIPIGQEISATQKEMAKDILAKSQEGYLSNLPKKILGGISGVPAEETKKATDFVSKNTVNKLHDSGLKLNPEKKYTNLEIADWIENSGTDVLGKTARKDFVDPIKTALKKEGEIIDNAINVATKDGKKVSISKHKEPLLQLEKTYIDAFNETGAEGMQQSAKDVRNILEKYFPKDGTEEISPKSAWQLKKELADKIDFNRTPVQVSSDLERAISQSEKGLREDIYKVINGEEAQKAYAAHSDIMDNLYKLFKDNDTAVNTLKNPETLRKPGVKKQIEMFDKKYNTSLGELSDIATTWKYFGRPATTPVVGGGSGQFWRGAGAGGAIGGALGTAVGGPMGTVVGGGLGGLVGGALTSPAAIKLGLQGETAATKGLQSIAQRLGGKKALDLTNMLRQKLPEVTQSAITPQAGFQSAWKMMKGQ